MARVGTRVRDECTPLAGAREDVSRDIAFTFGAANGWGSCPQIVRPPSPGHLHPATFTWPPSLGSKASHGGVQDGGGETWHAKGVPKQVANVASDDYLSAVYRLNHDEGEDVIAARLADRLGVTPPSVAGMLKRLQRDELVTISEKKFIELTAEGLRRAEEMVRRHRLAECLLTSVLQVPWWRAYEEAHLLEHGISDVTEPHLIETLGNPVRSPFGYPIPGLAKRGTLSMRTLADVPEGETVEIERVFEEDEELLRFFDSEGLRPGQKVELVSSEPYRGTVTVGLDGRDVVMGTQVANRVWVA